MRPRRTGTPRHEELSVFIAGGLYTTLVGIRRSAIRGQPLRATTESLCTLPACWITRSALGVGTQIRSHALYAALDGWQELNPPTWQSWLRICPDHDRREGGRRWKVPCSSPNFLRKTEPGWCRLVM